MVDQHVLVVGDQYLRVPEQGVHVRINSHICFHHMGSELEMRFSVVIFGQVAADTPRTESLTMSRQVEAALRSCAVASSMCFKRIKPVHRTSTRWSCPPSSMVLVLSCWRRSRRSWWRNCRAAIWLSCVSTIGVTGILPQNILFLSAICSGPSVS